MENEASLLPPAEGEDSSKRLRLTSYPGDPAGKVKPPVPLQDASKSRDAARFKATLTGATSASEVNRVAKDIRDHFKVLHDLIFECAIEYFGISLDEDDPAGVKKFDLRYVCKNAPEFYVYALDVADGRFDGWNKLFQDPYDRAQVIIGIIYQVLDLYVFQRPMFGATPQQEELLHLASKSTWYINRKYSPIFLFARNQY